MDFKKEIIKLVNQIDNCRVLESIYKYISKIIKYKKRNKK